MKSIIKNILLFLSIIIFIFSCKNNTGVSKYQGTYRGSVNTTQGSERQLIVNTATVTINANDSINVMMEGGNIYDRNVYIVKEELTRVNDDTYNAQKYGNSYTFTFYNDYMNLNIHNTDNYVTDGQLPKAQ